MQHSAMAMTLYRVAASIQAVVDFCPGPVAALLSPLVVQINKIGDWHYQQSRAQQ